MSDAVLATGPGGPWPTSHRARRLGHRLAAHVLATAFGTALLGTAATLIAAMPHDRPAPPPAIAPVPLAWHEIIKPVRIFSLEAPMFAGMPAAYAARRHADGGGREDVLALGTPGDGKPALRLRIFRRAAETPSAAPFLATLAHEAAQAGLAIDRSGVPGLVPTRFGAFTIMDVALAAAGAPAVPCEAFRMVRDAPALSITGFACAGRGASLSRAATGCLIERLDVAAARDDRELIDFFAATELLRNAGCAGMRLAPDTLHAAWLDDPDDTPGTARKSLRRR